MLHTEHEIGILGAINPFVTLIFAPMWTLIADHYEVHKSILLITFLGSVFTRVGLLFVPQSRLSLTSFLVAVSASFSAPVRPLLDAAIMKQLKKKSSYGRSRLFGQLGFGLGSYMAGIFLSGNIEHTVLLHATLAVPAAAVMIPLLPGGDVNRSYIASNAPSISLSEKQRKNWEAIISLVPKAKIPYYVHFFGTVFVVGVLSGIVENFAFNRIIEVTGIDLFGNQFGVIPLAASIVGALLFWMSGQIISLIGVPNILLASLLSYLLRLMIYAYITDPWHAVVAEMIRGATYSLFWAATTYFVYNTSPRGHVATMVRPLYF